MRIFLIALAVALPTAVSAQMVQPGQWETVSTVTSVKGGNFPPAVAAAMRGRPTVIRHCVTPAEAAAGPREMMKPSTGCKFDRFSMVGGRYAALMRCDRPGSSMTVNATGAYTPVSAESTATMVMKGRMAMTMTATTKSRRIGAWK